jgi:hypothetical protein
MSLISITDSYDLQLPELLGRYAVKRAADTPELSYSLGGRLFISQSGWGLLSVPNALVRGAFAALHEPGAELPPGFNAHISVLRPEDLDQIGGPDKVKERGQVFRYTLGPLRSVKPAGWPGISRVWFIEVNSPELQQLRKSYGLTPLPKDNEFKFHITVATRKTGVLQANELSRAS